MLGVNCKEMLIFSFRRRCSDFENPSVENLLAGFSHKCTGADHMARPRKEGIIVFSTVHAHEELIVVFGLFQAVFHKIHGFDGGHVRQVFA